MPLFDIRRDGQPVRYLGRRIKRAAPGPADYVRLDPGASLSKTVELSVLYEMSVTGSYTIRYHSAAMPAPGAGVQAVVGELVSKPVSIWVDGRPAARRQAGRHGAGTGRRRPRLRQLLERPAGAVGDGNGCGTRDDGRQPCLSHLG